MQRGGKVLDNKSAAGHSMSDFSDCTAPFFPLGFAGAAFPRGLAAGWDDEDSERAACDAGG